MNFIATCKKDYSALFLTAEMVDINANMVSFDFQPGNSPHIYQRYIRTVYFLYQRFNVFDIIKGIDENETRARTVGNSRLDDEALF